MDPIRTCTDCGGELEPVDLLDSTNPGRKTKADPDGAQHKVASYGDAGGTPHWFDGRRGVRGKVRALLCSGCRRIFLYGEPR